MSRGVRLTALVLAVCGALLGWGAAGAAGGPSDAGAGGGVSDAGVAGTQGAARFAAAVNTGDHMTSAALAAGEPALTPLQRRGQEMFAIKCLPCHGPGVWGTNRLARRFGKDKALLTNRTDLTVAGVTAVVRIGVGSMPPYRKTEVDNADLAAIAAYLTRPR